MQYRGNRHAELPKFHCISYCFCLIYFPLPQHCLQVIDKLSASVFPCTSAVFVPPQGIVGTKVSLHIVYKACMGSHLFKKDLHPDSSAHRPSPPTSARQPLSHIAKSRTCPATSFTLARLSHHSTPRSARLSQRFRLTARYGIFSHICLIHHHLACRLRMLLNVAGHGLGTSLWLQLSTDGCGRFPGSPYRLSWD